MDIKKEALEAHLKWQGKIEVISRTEIKDSHALSLAYTPGVAEACLKIADCPDKAYELTRRHNLIAVITDGSAVLGLGDIGPSAAMPVMEGKCALFKEFADIDAFPLCIKTQDIDEFVKTVALLSDSFGGINLEDIAAPRCFEIERRLKEVCDIPVFHDDQHGTAIVVAAALINALRLVKKDIASIKCVINGAGAAGTAIAEHLLSLGVKNIIMCDKAGALARDDEALSPAHKALAAKTNPDLFKGDIKKALIGADVFIGVSAPNILSAEDISKMAADSIVFAMANPVPEIMPEEAALGGARVVGTGRSDYPNQINNVLAFPGIFRGALDVRAGDITAQMRTAASFALAALVRDTELCEDYILPPAFDNRIATAVAAAVAKAARDCGAARI